MTFQAAAGPAYPPHAGRIPLYGPEFAADPAATYQMLRQYGPVAPVELAPGVAAYLVVGYDEVLKATAARPRGGARIDGDKLSATGGHGPVGLVGVPGPGGPGRYRVFVR
jgi:hypothetical protein